MTRLRKMMLEELQRRNFAQSTIQYYLQAVEDFAAYFHKAPDHLTPHHLRQYQAYLLSERKLQPRTARLHVCALRFFFRKTLRRPLPPDDLPYPKAPRRLPTILTVEEVARLIDSARNLFERTLLMVLYSTGMRNAEMRHLQVKDIDSQSMLIHIQHGKGGRDRYVPLSPRLLDTLREHWRWMKPKTRLFPGTVHNWRAVLFQASAATLLEVAADPRHLGAQIGFLSVLHTWDKTCSRILTHDTWHYHLLPLQRTKLFDFPHSPRVASACLSEEAARRCSEPVRHSNPPGEFPKAPGE